MFNRLNFKKISAIVLGIIITGYSVTGFGQMRKIPHRRFVVKHPVPRYGKVIVKPPVGYKTIRRGGARYFYHRGIYYRKGPSGFVVVRAPIGAVVPALAVGFITSLVGGLTYYYYGGVYYQKAPSGYVVVKAPSAAVVVEEPPVVVSGRVSVTAITLNIRSGPGMNFEVIGQVSQNDVMVIIGNAPEWLYIKLPSGKFGWVSEKFTTPVFPPPSG